MAAPIPVDEADRLADLRSLRVLVREQRLEGRAPHRGRHLHAAVHRRAQTEQCVLCVREVVPGAVVHGRAPQGYTSGKNGPPARDGAAVARVSGHRSW